ncbi:MAG: biosynthetic-type acetolactate synthase large subunit [Dehalococcoidales bacterium]|nr:biosynthetic-type acetolactate synthase large subunit [Dehalococcoidales bacterium]
MIGAQIVWESLLKEGVEVVFGYPGAASIPLYDTLPGYPRLRHVLVRHEQAAAHAADGYARATGKVGVCMATSGPGATNLVTGIANAYLDSVPMVAITAQVARPVIGTDAFQEVDTTGITLPITKESYLVLEADSLARVLKESFHLARTGRTGPVLVDVAKNALAEAAEYRYPEKVDLPGYKPVLRGHAAQVKRAAKMINEAERPLILAGRGVAISGAHHELRELAEAGEIPVVTTLLGFGCFPESHTLSFGMYGASGANLALEAANLIIALGTKFDDRVSEFTPRAKVIHIDIDPAEIGKNVKVDVPIVGDARQVLGAIVKQILPREHSEWLKQLGQWRNESPLSVGDGGELTPQYVVRQIYEVTGSDAIVVTGVGEHRMWAEQHCCGDRPNGLISAGGLGTMGFGLPAAVGAKIGCPDDTVWCIDGDASFQTTMQELGTIAQEGLDVKIAVINNRRYMATPLSGPDFVPVAEAYGIPGLKVTERAGVAPAIERALSEDGPFLIDFVLKAGESV